MLFGCEYCDLVQIILLTATHEPPKDVVNDCLSFLDRRVDKSKEVRVCCAHLEEAFVRQSAPNFHLISLIAHLHISLVNTSDVVIACGEGPKPLS